MKIAAFILCAGYGTRLGKLTESKPKPMLDVSGKPILWYSMENIKRAGVTDVLINLHYFGKQIEDYLASETPQGMSIRFSREEKPIGTAGALLNVLPELLEYDYVLCHYGDVLCNMDLRALIQFHAEKSRPLDGADLSFLVHRRQKGNSLVVAEPSGKVTQFLERPTEQEQIALGTASPHWVNSGIYMVSTRSLLPFAKREWPLDFPKDIFPDLLKAGKLFQFPLKGFRLAIDSPERLRLANETITTPAAFWELPE